MHITWDFHISPDNGNSLLNWISSSQLDTLNDSDTLLHHSSGFRSSPDVSLAPAQLAPTCEWRTLPGLGSVHLPINITLQLSSIWHSNTRAPAFNLKGPLGWIPKIHHWSPFPSYRENAKYSLRSSLLIPVKCSQVDCEG